MFKQSQDPGLGEKYFRHTKRIINKDGSFNVIKTGGDFSSINAYHYLINVTWIKFLFVVFSGFILVNLFLLYYIRLRELKIFQTPHQMIQCTHF
jgi:inward rectifier potassium channel